MSRLLREKATQGMEFGDHRTRKLQGQVNSLQEKINQWVRSGGLRRPYALEQTREELARIAADYKAELREEAERFRNAIAQEDKDLRAQLRSDSAGEQIRQDEERLEAKLAADEALQQRLANFAASKDLIGRCVAFTSWAQLQATYEEAERRGLPIVENFRQAWNETDEPMKRIYFDRPNVVSKLERARFLESIPEGKVILRRTDDGGQDKGEFVATLEDLVDMSKLDQLAE